MPSTAANPGDQPEKNEQDDRAECGVGDERDLTGTEVDAQLRQQPIADKCPDDADDQVADETVAATPHDVAGEPSGDNADNNNDDQTVPIRLTPTPTTFRSPEAQSYPLDAQDGRT